MSRAARVRLELDQRRAAALHAAVSEALSAQLLAGDRRDAARELLDDLDAKVPGWLTAAPLGGEAGYLLAAEAVLRALVDAEDRGHSTLSEIELLRAVGDAKPLGTTASDVLGRMRREQLVRARSDHSEERWWTAAPPGRQFLHRDTAARDDAWAVKDADALLDLIHAEHRPGGRAHRASVQAIGRLADSDVVALLEQLEARDLLEWSETNDLWLELSWRGEQLARERWRDSGTGHRVAWAAPPPPPLPFHRALPIRIAAQDRRHPSRWPDQAEGRDCAPAAWLQHSSKTKLWATLRRDGAAQWTCRHCDSHWLVYLQACGRDDRPAYRDPPKRPTTARTGAGRGSHDRPPAPQHGSRARRRRARSSARPPRPARRPDGTHHTPGSALPERQHEGEGRGGDPARRRPHASSCLQPAADSACPVAPGRRRTAVAHVPSRTLPLSAKLV